MPETCEPFDGGPYLTESGWSTLWSTAVSDGVLNRNDPSSLQVYTDNDGRQVKVRPGVMHIRGHIYQATDVVTVPLPPNKDPNDRVDRIVVRLDDSLKRGFITALTGTPAPAPVAPALTQAPNAMWEMALNRVRVRGTTLAPPSGFATVDSANMVDERQWASSSSVEPWQTWNPSLFPGSGPAFPFVETTRHFAEYVVRGDMCHFHYSAEWTFQTGAGDPGYIGLSLPVEPLHDYSLLPADVQNDVGRAFTHVAGTSTPNGWIEMYPNRQNNGGVWLRDGATRSARIAGSYRISN